MASLKDKVVLITGASVGIGAGAAVYMAGLGCRLALVARSVDNLNKVKQDCKKKGLPEDKIYLIQGDLRNEETAKSAIDNTVEHFGQLDVLVNNAGTTCEKPIEEATLEDYDQLMNLNIRAAFYLTTLAIPHLKKTKGSIVNVSSVQSSRPGRDNTIYSMSKGALEMLTRSVAMELGVYGIRVNSVRPGLIETELQRRAGMDEDTYQKLVERFERAYPLGRIGTVDEVAKAIAFLASDDASFITGTGVVIDGGHLIAPVQI